MYLGYLLMTKWDQVVRSLSFSTWRHLCICICMCIYVCVYTYWTITLLQKSHSEDCSLYQTLDLFPCTYSQYLHIVQYLECTFTEDKWDWPGHIHRLIRHSSKQVRFFWFSLKFFMQFQTIVLEFNCRSNTKCQIILYTLWKYSLMFCLCF